MVASVVSQKASNEPANFCRPGPIFSASIDELDSVAVRKIYRMISDNDLCPLVGVLSGFGVAALLLVFAGPLGASFF